MSSHTDTWCLRRRGLYLWDELKQRVGVECANGQGYEVEQQPFVKGFLHEGHHAGTHQRAQRDQCHTQDPITPDWLAKRRKGGGVRGREEKKEELKNKVHQINHRVKKKKHE